MKQIIKNLTLLCALATPLAAGAQSANVYLPGTYDVGGTTEYSQYLYIGPGATVTIPAGQQWIIASQYVFISPLAVINGTGQMIFENPGKIGTLNETVAWAGQPTTVDGGNSKILAPVLNRNPNNIVLGPVSVTGALSGLITANALNTLNIGTSFTWAATNADGTALTGNDVLLGNYDMRFAATATEAGYDANSFAVTNGTGHVVKDSYTGAFTYPVGRAEGDYTPAAITNTTANGMHVSVQDYATSASSETFGSAGAGMDRTWNIYADNAAGNSSINLQHNSSTNATGFLNTSYYVTRYGSATPNTSGDNAGGNGTAWQSNTLGAGATGTLVDPAGTVAGSSMRSHSYTSFATTSAATTAYFTKLSAAPLETTPDFNVTYKNVPVSGSVATNDNVPVGSTYGTPVAQAGNPNTALPVVNPDGTYTFVTSVPGEYNFMVPVCNNGVCVNELLNITVLDNVNPVNPPVANNDNTSTPQGSPVTVPVLGNDRPGTPGRTLPPGNVVVIDNGPGAGNTPGGGTATVNPDGSVTYTPTPGFSGIDTVIYQVCDNGSPSLCDTAMVFVTVNPTGTPNTTTANDDYASTPVSTPVSGNVLTNDHDAEGNTQTAVAQNVTIPGKGTLALAANGTYTFTPVPGFTGPVEFVYSITDNGSPVAGDTATLHILVNPPALETTPDFNETYVSIPVAGNVATNDNVPPGATYGTPVAQPGYTNPSTAMPVVNPNGTYTFVTTVPGEYNFLVPVCTAGVCVNELLNITVLDNVSTAVNPPVANNDNTTTLQNTPVNNIPVLSNDRPGTPGRTLPPGNVVVIDNGPAAGNTPAGGTATTNPDGTLNYTPPTGFTGVDTIRYQVCDNGSPSLCDTAMVFVTVNPTGTPNTTTAVDDYANTPVSTPVSGNVLTNDRDAEGNTQTAVAQNVTIPGKGTLVLNTNGTYTFTPVPGFMGPIDFPYSIADNGSPVAGDTATLHILVNEPALETTPDFNATYVGVSVPGNVKTNDNVPPTASYGTPVAQPGYTNPNGAMPVVNPDGTYTFVTTVPGEYNFMVPVCDKGVCVSQLLNITVLDSVTPNPPVVNNDITTTPQNTPVTVPVLGNDRPGTPGRTLPPGNVAVIDNGPGAGNTPGGGTVTTNPDGTIVYTPLPGFTGVDTIRYQVCDDGSPSLCDTALVFVTVQPTGSPNSTTANDDYATTPKDQPVSSNVLSNDRDAEGNTQTAVAQNTTIPGKGTLVLNTNGTYTFTPVAGFTGPVEFPYSIADNGSPVARDTATLHILVMKATPNLSPVIKFMPALVLGIQTIGVKVDVYEFNDVATTGAVTVYIPKNGLYTLSYNPAATTIGGQAVQNSTWTFDGTSNPSFYIMTRNASIPASGGSSFGFTTTINPNNQTGFTQVSAIILDNSGGESDADNVDNADDDRLDYSF